MARATTGSWRCIAITMMLTMAAAAQGMPLPLALLSSVPGQIVTSAHAALNQGIECYRQGNYEAAAKALSQAQASRSDLSANEQQELDNWTQLNRQALQQQTLGREQLRQAEAAARAGQTAEADALRKAVVGNSYVSAADKQRALTLSTDMRAATGAPMGATEPGAMARAKLRQARVFMTQGNLDAAVTLAEDAARLGTAYQAGEDTPGRVLEDVHRAQSDPKTMLLLARTAFRNGDLDTAERLARQADHSSSAWTFWMRGDKPADLLHDIQIQRKRQAAIAGSSFPTAPASAFAHGSVSPYAPRTVTASAMPITPSIAAAPPAPSLQLNSSVSISGKIDSMGLPTRPQVVTDIKATTPSVQAQATGIFNQGRSAEDQAQAHVAAQLHATSTMSPTALVQSNASVPPAALPSVEHQAKPDARKEQALALMAEARHFQKREQLVEAYQKVVEAQRLGVSFQLTEENPQAMRLELCAKATRQMENLMHQANAAQTAGDQKQAREQLMHARLLATSFGLDCQPIDLRLNSLQPGHANTAPANAMLPAVDAKTALTMNLAGGVTGPQMLERARQEIRAGHNDKARKWTEKAFQSPDGVKAEAEALLRTICAEEYKQRCKTADRLFDAGMSMYHRQDYVAARQCFGSLDAQALSPEHRTKLREVMATPEMRPHEIVQASAHEVEPVGDPGKATASDTPGKSHVITPEQNYAQQYEAQQQLAFQQMYWKGTQALRRALERMQAHDLEQALTVLEDYLADLKASNLDPEKIARLRRPVEIRLTMIKKIRADIAAETERDASRIQWTKKNREKIQREVQKEKQVAELMEQYKTLYKAGQYREALLQAEKAHDLDPDNVQVNYAVKLADTAKNKKKYDDLKKQREELTLVGLDEAEAEGQAVGNENPLLYDTKRWGIVTKRPKGVVNTQFTLETAQNEKAKEIQAHLKMPVQISFNNTPLKQALSELSAENSINIVPDKAALEAENISLEAPLSLQVEGIQLQSALNLLLNQLHLTYVIQNEVLLVTTNAKASDRLVRAVYQVADLIIPIEDHGVPPTLDLQTMLERSLPRNKHDRLPQRAADQHEVVPGGEPISTTNGHVPTSGATPWATTTTSPQGVRPVGQTIQDTLIDLVTNSIKPESWSKMGGPGTIDYYPLGMALVVNQTPDIQEQIASLLEALRRLQDLEVTIEVRFITLEETFYERIGVDFGVNFTNRQTKYQPQLVTGNFAPPNFINSFMPNSFLSGITSQATGPLTGGTFTPDLGIPIQASSFGPAVPPFGGFTNSPPDGGIQLGLAFLSDIQVYMLLEAAQADRRTNIMQAPKLTMFNGQTSTITLADTQFFVTNVEVVTDNGQIVFVPQNSPLPIDTTSVAIQAVVSADRRFVRMNIIPTITQRGVQLTTLFPITTFITPVFEGGSVGQPIPFTQFLQQPELQTVFTTTTVSVPDGGTVLMGGMKTLREGRNEFGPPILSQLPYINRLFKNVGYGRETQSLMIMVTPRIIINSEEEDLQINQGRGGLLSGATPATGQPAGGPAALPPPTPVPATPGL